jgi:hypothetical protein
MEQMTRKQYDKAVRERKQVVERNGADAIRAAEIRLCGSCHFEATACVGMCGVNSLLSPLTYDGRECPYHLPKVTKSPALALEAQG